MERKTHHDYFRPETEAPIQWASPAKEMWKMKTTNGGTSMWLKFDKAGNGVTVH